MNAAAVEMISSFEFLDALIAAKWDPLGHTFDAGAFSNEDCAGLEGSLPRWNAFHLICSFLTGIDVCLAAHETALALRARGGLS